MGCGASKPQKPSSASIHRQQKHKESLYKGGHLSNNLVRQEHSQVKAEERYEVVRQLGVGSMGTVAAVRCRPKIQHAPDPSNSTPSFENDCKLYALKTIRSGRVNHEFLAELKNEIEAVRQMDHPGIVKFYEVIYFPRGISILMDYLSGGDLHKRKPYSEIQAASIMKQVLHALKYIHSRNFIHLDIKFENVMFVNKDPTASVKIIDFGFATRHDPSRVQPHKQLGTFDTMSPEVFSGNYTTQADIWSAGCVTYQLLCGQKPFAAMTPMGVIGKIAQGKINLKDYGWKEKSKESKDFVQALITKDPSRRPTAKQALDHKWLKDRLGGHNCSDIDTCCQPQQIHNQLERYSRAPALKKIGLLLIAHKTFPDEVVELRKQFEHFDQEQTGEITVEEFQKALRGMNETGPSQEIEKLFQSMDTYQNGVVAYTEFLAALLEGHMNITEDRIADAFDRIDVTNSGYVTKEDLRLLLGKDFTEEYANEIICQIDYDQSGRISYEEFLQAFRTNSSDLGKRTKLIEEEK